MLKKAVLTNLLFILLWPGTLGFGQDTKDIWDVAPIFGLYGAGALAKYSGFTFIKGRQTILLIGGSIFGRQMPFYRNAGDELLTRSNKNGFNLDEDIKFWLLNINWQLGLTQGFVFNKRTRRNMLEATLVYNGRFDKHFESSRDKEQIIFNQTVDLPDREGLQQNSFTLGITFDYLIKDKYAKLFKGVKSELSIEWGPSFLNPVADFSRLDFQIAGFIPLFSRAMRNGAYLSLYFGDFLLIDWSYGDTIPVNVRQSTGGLFSQRPALGGLVRAVDEYRYDAYFKLANCADLRLVLPVLLITPGFVYFFDTAYYNQLKGTDGGVLLSTGLGLFIEVLDMFQFTAYTGWFLNGENIDGRQWMPFAFEAAFHF